MLKKSLAERQTSTLRNFSRKAGFVKDEITEDVVYVEDESEFESLKLDDDDISTKQRTLQ